MNKKTFIIAVSVVAALAIAIATFALWPRSNADQVGTGEVYTLTDEDSIEVESIARDFLTRTSEFGTTIEDDSNEAKAESVYELSIAIGGEDFSPLFKTRYDTIRSASELITPDSSFYPKSSPYDLRLDEDLFGYRQFSSTINNVSLPEFGNHQILSRGEELPSVNVSVDLSSTVRDRAPRTMAYDSEADPGISAPGWTIEERAQLVDQSFTVQLLKTDAGWKVYNIANMDYPEVIAAFTPVDTRYEEMMVGSSRVTYDYKFDGDEHDHEH